MAWKKLSKVERSFRASQNGHKRYIKEHEKNMIKHPEKYDLYFQKKSYHSYCYNVQQKTGKRFNQKEKEEAFRDVISTFY